MMAWAAIAAFCLTACSDDEKLPTVTPSASGTMTDNDGNMLSGAKYDYFCITSDELYLTHTPDDDFIIPDCTATAYNFYYYEDYILDTYSLDAVNAIINDQQGSDIVSVRFSSSSAYEDAVNDLIGSRNWRSLTVFQDQLSMSYYNDDDRYILTFYLY